MEFKATIGLEIHAELKTKTKMFCSCKNDTDEKRPNINICPVCLGHPGTLPVINKEAVRQVLKVGLAIGGKLAEKSEFDRKNYFYPDIPKGYQISQYKLPLVSGGNLNGINITRVHLEEDTAKSSHEESLGSSLVDFNRAGVPLMELVTEPEMHSGEEVSRFGKELRALLQYLGVSEANMEKGEMRLEANVSVSNSEKLGTKVEIKNLNSFNSAEKGVVFEIKRQAVLLKEGKSVKQETRGWDENKQETFSQRSKEDSHDYRYFPDPDLPKLSIKDLAEFSKEALILEIKETPSEKRNRLKHDFGIKDEHIEVYINYPEISNFFEATINYLHNNSAKTMKSVDAQTVSNYIVSDLMGMSKKSGGGFSLGMLSSENLGNLFIMLGTREVSSRGVKDILKIMFDNGGNPEAIAKEKGLIQKNNPDELKNIMQRIILDNPDIVSEYKNGKGSVIQFLVGQGMKATKGSANPLILKDILEKLI